MRQSPHPCLIHQPDCCRTSTDPICPKCGLDERMRYIDEAAALLAKSQAQARYLQSHAQSLEARSSKPEPAKVHRVNQSQNYQVGEVFRDLPETPQMVVLPSGSFLMGTADDEVLRCTNERPQHLVTISYILAMSRYPVTFEEWDVCLADGGTDHKPEDEGWGRGKHPVINVSWNDAQAYIAWLNKKLGFDAQDQSRYRLPSEAEWEYACRAGTTVNFSTPSGKVSENDVHYRENSVYLRGGRKHEETTPVGTYTANGWRLYDMYGNPWEWVQDGYEDSYREAPTDGSAREAVYKHRVVRGGSRNGHPDIVRFADRDYAWPRERKDNIGFRLARAIR